MTNADTAFLVARTYDRRGQGLTIGYAETGRMEIRWGPRFYPGEGDNVALYLARLWGRGLRVHISPEVAALIQDLDRTS